MAHQVQQAFLELGRQAMSPPFGEKVLHGVFAGWLIALLVWILGAAHVIAGSVEALFLLWPGQISWWDAVGGYTLPALIGNTIGGISLVAAVNHAQVIGQQD